MPPMFSAKKTKVLDFINWLEKILKLKEVKLNMKSMIFHW